MSVLGFYRPTDGPERLLAVVKPADDGLYIEIPSAIRNRMEIIAGERIRCLLESITDQQKQQVNTVGKEAIWQVGGYWHELHVPPEFVRAYGVHPGDRVQVVLKSVLRDGKEEEI